MFNQQSSIISSVIQLVTTFVEGVLALRLILKLFGASPTAPFVDWVYQTSAPLLVPFQGIFPSPKLTGFFVIEFSTLFAILVYTIAGYVLAQLVYLVDRTFTPDVEERKRVK